MQTLKRAAEKLNRVIEWGRDGITIEAVQRHVREILKDLELEQANHSATPCAVARKNEGNGRSDESKRESRRGQGQTQTTHEWDGMSDGDDKDRSHMAGDDANVSQALTGGDITKDRALVARGPDLKFASMRVCCVENWEGRRERGSEGRGGGGVPRWEAKSSVTVPLATEK